MTDRQIFALAVLGYLLSTVYSIFLWRRGFRTDNRIVYLLLLVSAGLHTLAMGKRGLLLSRCPVTNLYEATTFFGWTMVAAYLGVGLLRRLRFLGAFAAPVLFALGVFALMPALDSAGPQPQFTRGVASLHASLILLAYGAFGLGAVGGAIYLVQRHDLKFHKARAVLSFLPSIQRLETVMKCALEAGLVLLTVGLLMGCVWLKREKGVYFKPDPKVLWSMFVWVVYLGLLIWRRRSGHGGRKLAWGTIASFVFVMLTFWGFNLLSEIHQP